MNNSQFRKLVLDTPARQAAESDGKGGLGATPRRDGATPSLGSRMRSSMPMTPRSVASAGGVDFRRQLAEQNAANQPTKKFRSTAVPKGAKLAPGYIDRTKDRVSDEDDDKGARVKALEEMMKLQQIDQATFEKLRDEIIGGDVGSVHLVKGLDYKLLERVRRGEDVLSGSGKDDKDGEDEEEAPDVDDELDELEEREINAITKNKAAKRGEMAPPTLVPGQKRSRDQILAEMKAARLAAKEAAQPSLGSKFRKVGAPRFESRIERDGKGREVLITVDEDGNEKRKVRKVQPDADGEKSNGLLMPDKDVAPLGMEVPELPKAPGLDEEIDIFDDVGDDYDPLAGLDGSDDDSDKEDEAREDGEIEDSQKPRPDVEVSPTESSPDKLAMPPPPLPAKPVSRNYFGDSKKESESSAGSKAMADATILAALKKASSLAQIDKAAESSEEGSRQQKLKKMLESSNRDDDDLDMGFGSSRFEDEADFGDEKIKLSQWGDDDDGDEGVKGGKKERKRGPKKRKGDANSAADVLKVMEERKKAGR